MAMTIRFGRLVPILVLIPLLVMMTLMVVACQSSDEPKPADEPGKSSASNTSGTSTLPPAPPRDELIRELLRSRNKTNTPYTAPPLAFSGDSDQASETVVVPTLDTPIPGGKNVVWCATFQLCWDELTPLFAINPDDVPGSPETAERLSNARIDKVDLPAGGYYVAAGRVKDGIARKIQSDMAKQFPHVTPHVAAPAETAVLAYAYLNGSVKFSTPYFDREQGDEFVDSAGKRTPITSFGLYRQREAPINTTLAKQIEILVFPPQYEDVRA